MKREDLEAIHRRLKANKCKLADVHDLLQEVLRLRKIMQDCLKVIVPEITLEDMQWDRE